MNKENKFSLDEMRNSIFVWDNADRTEMYKDILDELLNSEEGRAKVIMAENIDDYAKIEIGTNFLGKYIVQLVNDVVEYIGQKQGREETEDEIKEEIGLSLFCKYKKG